MGATRRQSPGCALGVLSKDGSVGRVKGQLRQSQIQKR